MDKSENNNRTIGCEEVKKKSILPKLRKTKIIIILEWKIAVKVAMMVDL